MKKLAFVAAAALCASGVALLRAHVPLVGGGEQLEWEDPEDVQIVINSTGSDDIVDGSHETALRLAIQEWNSAVGSELQLVEETAASQQARTDWTSSGIHLIWFDENNSSGFFPNNSGTVAITPVLFNGDGDILDADVLFNGSGFSFTTSGQMGSFDVGDVAVHELGHLVGFDHSPWVGSTMYPYVDPAVILHRSLSADEVHGLRDLYPSASFGEITGRIRRASDDSRVRGALVVARNTATGRTTSSILTRAGGEAGEFRIEGLEPGTYDVYATPLGNGNFGDGPVDPSNISSYTIQTDFESTEYPTTATVVGTEAVSMGTLLVDADTAFNLGTNIDRFPIRVSDGMSQTIVLRGNGLLDGSTLVASDSDFVIGTPMWFGTSVSFQLTVPDGETPGHVDLIATSPTGDRCFLPGALEVTPPSPTVATVAPTTGPAAGGTAVTITGTEFHPGARVVVGDQIYTDGIAGTNVVDPTTITLTTSTTIAGTHDVVVIDATGVEGRLAAGFTSAAIPVVATVFPESGVVTGGTEVVLTGFDFVAGAAVRIDGVDQGAVTVESASLLRFTTQLGAAGARMLEVENPGGALATSAFTYYAQPDPVLLSVAPTSVKESGGATLTLVGSTFTVDTGVVFDADPETGLGGLPAASVTFVSATELTAVTPEFGSKGDVSVLVRDASTSQADLLDDALSVTGDGGGGGGGGGCYMVPVSGPPDPRSLLLGGWWMLAILLVAAGRARRAAPERS